MLSVFWHCLVGHQEGHLAFKNWVVTYWRGYLSGARCKWFASGPADATATASSLALLKSRFNGLTYLVTADPSCLGKEAIKQVSVCLSVCLSGCLSNGSSRWYGDGACNTIEKISSIFSLIQIHKLQSARHAGSKTLLQQNPAVFNCGCWLTHIVVYNGRKTVVHSVSKNAPHLACYNFDTFERILIFFGRNVTDRVSSQKMLCFTCSSALPSKTGEHENCIFHSNAILMHCQNSASRCLISSVFLTHDSYSHCCMTP